MNKELIVILEGMIETNYGLCSSIIGNSYKACRGVLCSSVCVGSLVKRRTPNHYVYLIASIPL